MNILGIETSCDETSVSVVQNGTKVLSNVIASSKTSFERSGGVIPEQAARKQVESIHACIQQALEEANCEPRAIDAIAITKGPGLLVSLLVGTTVARTLASIWKKPLIGVHHTLGHLSSIWLECDEDIVFPLLSLSVSGGHSDLWYRTSHTEGTLIGQTLDDAAGEAYDKGASLLGLPYPGGPAISKEAMSGDDVSYDFPKPLHDKPGLNFSFSGLKTALKYTLEDIDSIENNLPDITASYQRAINEHLVMQMRRAIKKYPDAQEVHIVGGVSANSDLRERVESAVSIPMRVPSTIQYCTDNAAMIAAAGYFLVQEKGQQAYEEFETKASLSLH